MAPIGNLDTVAVDIDGPAPDPPGMALASRTGSGAPTDSASDQLAGTDRVPSAGA